MSFTPGTGSRPDDGPWPELAWPVADGTVLTGRTAGLAVFDADEDAEPLFAALDHDTVWAHVSGRPVSASHHNQAGVVSRIP